MIISAFSDLDRSNVKELEKALKDARKPDLLLLAGDIGFMGDPNQGEKYRYVLSLIEKNKWNCPIIAVFGNHEEGKENEIISATRDKILFLRDQAITLEINGKSIGIVGSIGVLDSTTFWESGGVIGMIDHFGERIEHLFKLMKGLKTDVKILLTHYAPTYKTLEGEPEELWEVMGSEVLETLIKRTKVNFAVHGHAHHGKKVAFIESGKSKIPVMNVAFPLNKKIVEILIE